MKSLLAALLFALAVPVLAQDDDVIALMRTECKNHPASETLKECYVRVAGDYYGKTDLKLIPPKLTPAEQACQNRPGNEGMQHCLDRMAGKQVSDLSEDEKKAAAAAQSEAAKNVTKHCQNLAIGDIWTWQCGYILYPGDEVRRHTETWADGRKSVSFHSDTLSIIYFLDSSDKILNIVQDEDN